VLFWSCVLIGSISRRRCGPCFAECFAGSRCQNGLTAPGKLVITAVGEVGGHFDCEEDQTTLSPDCPKPCQPDVRRRSPQNPGKKISAAQEISLTRSWRVLERVSERVVTTRQTGCGKGSPRRLRDDTRRAAHDNPRTRPIPRRARRNPLPMALPTRRTTRIPSRPTRPLPAERRRRLDQPTDG